MAMCTFAMSTIEAGPRDDDMVLATSFQKVTASAARATAAQPMDIRTVNARTSRELGARRTCDERSAQPVARAIDGLLMSDGLPIACCRGVRVRLDENVRERRSEHEHARQPGSRVRAVPDCRCVSTGSHAARRLFRCRVKTGSFRGEFRRYDQGAIDTASSIWRDEGGCG